jgi:bifunctional UDP-N-acetylglucosamine pyrophosphorylase/glucosamine-1-phosphate N-acetyltransferase
VEQPAAVILAAGSGTRMNSATPKVLHALCGRSMLAHVLGAVRRAGVGRIFVVVGRNGGQAIRDAIGGDVEYVVQHPARGTGDAVARALPQLRRLGLTYVVHGDMPFVSPATLRGLRRALRGTTAAALATRTVEHTHRFGRIVRDPAGRFVGIVEERDATPEQAAIREVNAGMYLFRVPDIGPALSRVRPNNRQGEYYLTDAVNLLAVTGRDVTTVAVGDPAEMLGINTREELAEAEEALRVRILRRLMAGGVTIVDPASTFVDAEVRVGRDTVLLPQTILSGRTVVGAGCEVGPGARLHDAVLGRGVLVRDSSLEGCRLGSGTTVGPYAHLRPGTVVGRNVEIGNFAEMKQVRVGDRTKVHHKSYLGDASIGADVNIGAGTITCNYGIDRRKHRTEIGRGAYIGSDTMLVAPVRVGREAVTGAGSVVTRNVPPQSVVVGVPARVLRRLHRRP